MTGEYDKWDDKAFVLESVKKYGSSLQSASDRLRDNEEIVREAVEQNEDALRYASDRIKKKLNDSNKSEHEKELDKVRYMLESAIEKLNNLFKKEV